MKKLLALSLSFLLVVALGTMAFASPKQESTAKPATEKKTTGEKKTAAKAGTTHQFTGNVTSSSDTEVTVEKKAGKGAPKTETFTINTDTKGAKDVKVGDHVTVHYKEMDGKKVATRITAKAAAKGGTAKKPAAKKSS